MKKYYTIVELVVAIIGSALGVGAMIVFAAIFKYCLNYLFG